MNDIDCILCDESSDNVAIEESGYTGKRCPNCDMIYISPRPSWEEIQEIYDEYQLNRSQAREVSVDPWEKRLFAGHHLDVIQSWKRQGTLLELGAGTGEFLAAARDAGYDVRGTELDAASVEFISSELGIPCQRSTLGESPYGTETFDVIYHRNVLSHFYDPVDELQTMNELLADDGILAFITGNYAEVDEDYYDYIPSFDYPDHLFLFGEKSIRELLAQADFEVVDVDRYSKLPWFRFQSAARPLKTSVVDLVGTDGDGGEAVETVGGRQATQANGGEQQRDSGVDLSAFRLLLQYLLLYKIGQYIPKEGHPQIMLVIAKKGETAQ